MGASGGLVGVGHGQGVGAVPGTSAGAPGASRWRCSGMRSAEGSRREDAAALAGVSSAVGTRWFRDCGGMRNVPRTPASGRFLSFDEREEIALLCARSTGSEKSLAGSVGTHRRCRGS